MKKTIFNNAIVAGIVSLTFTSMASAHHMSEEVNPNYDFVDEQISDMHNEVVDDLLEDDVLMEGMASSMGAEPTMTGMGSSDVSGNINVVSVPGTGSGSGMGSASGGGSSRR